MPSNRMSNRDVSTTLRGKATQRSLGQTGSFNPRSISSTPSYTPFNLEQSNRSRTKEPSQQGTGSWWSKLTAPLKYGTNPGFGGAVPGRSMKKSQMSQTEGY